MMPNTITEGSDQSKMVTKQTFNTNVETWTQNHELMYYVI